MSAEKQDSEADTSSTTYIKRMKSGEYMVRVNGMTKICNTLKEAGRWAEAIKGVREESFGEISDFMTC
ncbi:MAG: hypothetical protein RR235_05050 [Oscillospiraceae bacterium]